MPTSLEATPINGSLVEALRRARGDPSDGVSSVQAAVEHIRVFEERFGAATDAVDAWAAQPGSGVWPKLSATSIIGQVRTRIVSPWFVRQGPAPFCGPAAVAYELARRDPVDYVRIMRSLWETGGFTSRTGFEIEASSSLRKQTTFSNLDTNSRVPHADWMLLATLREHANLFLKVNIPEFDLKGTTTPWEIIDWSRRLIGLNRVDIHKAKPLGDLGADTGVVFPVLAALAFGPVGVGLAAAQAALSGLDHAVQAIQGDPIGPRKALEAGIRTLDAGGCAFLMVNSDLIGEDLADVGFLTQHAGLNVATHWIALVDRASDLVRRTTEPVGWTEEVAVDSTAETESASRRAPVSRVSGDAVELSFFSWNAIEYHTITVDQLRHHLFAVVTAG